VSLPRSIETRLLEAVWRETIACFAREDLGLVEGYGGPENWRIYPYPLLEAENVTPRQVNIVNVPPEYKPGIGGNSDSIKEIEVCFHFPVNNSLKFTPGQNSFLDEIKALQVWLNKGGTPQNNKNARLLDPDGNGIDQYINEKIDSFAWQNPYIPLKTKAAVVYPVLIAFSVKEDSQGIKR
jgi:hypothetical protein